MIPWLAYSPGTSQRTNRKMFRNLLLLFRKKKKKNEKQNILFGIEISIMFRKMFREMSHSRLLLLLLLHLFLRKNNKRKFSFFFFGRRRRRRVSFQVINVGLQLVCSKGLISHRIRRWIVRWNILPTRPHLLEMKWKCELAVISIKVIRIQQVGNIFESPFASCTQFSDFW